MKTGKKRGLALWSVGFAALTALWANAATAAKFGADQDVLLQANEVVYDANSQVVSARGKVEIDSGGRMLMADEVVYDQKTDTVTARGHVSLLDEKGNVAFADHVTLTDKMREGALEGFGALIGKNGRLAAASATRTEGRYTSAYRAAYTPCKICNQPGQRTPVWQVKSYRVVYDEVKHKIRFKDATLEVLGVPVFYTPYLEQPDPSVRYSSGLLVPDFGNSTTIGYFARLPFYIALSPSNDATISPMLSSLGGQQLEGEYRQRLQGGGFWLQASVTHNPEGGLGGNQDQIYSHLFGEGVLPLSQNWRAGYDVELTSNTTYLKRYDLSQLDRLANELFLEGTGGRSRFAVTGYFFQSLRPTDDNRTFAVPLPLIEYSYIPEHRIAGGQFRFDVNAVALTRDIGQDDQRMTAQMRWRLPFVTANGQLFTFQMNARGDVYHMDNAAPLPPNSQYVPRGTAYAGLDWRWPFVSAGGGGRYYLVEPIAQVVYAPYGGNPAAIRALNGGITEDSTSLELDENNIFSFDQLPGYDLVESGPRANVGMRAQMRFPIGYVEGLLGQSFRLKSDPIFAADSPFASTSSDVVGRFSIKLPPYVDLTHRIDIDSGSGTVRRNEVYLTGTLGRSSVQIGYAQLAASALTLGLPARQEVNAQADVNFYKNWQAFAAVRDNLDNGQILDSEYGLGYEDECLGLAVAYRRKYTSEPGLPPSTSVILRFKLKTGDQPIEPFSLFPKDVFSYTHP